jgi:hypothetical protein
MHSDPIAGDIAFRTGLVDIVTGRRVPNRHLGRNINPLFMLATRAMTKLAHLRGSYQRDD